MFFRPEEYTAISEGVDDVGFIQCMDIDIGYKDDGIGSLIFDPVIEFAVNAEVHLLRAVRTFRFDGHRQGFSA